MGPFFAGADRLVFLHRVTMTTSAARPGSRLQFAPLDLLTLVYTASSFVILAAQAAGAADLRLSSVQLTYLLTSHALLVVLVLLAAEARRRCCTKPCFLAEWYPLVVLMAVYGSVDLVNGPREAVGLSYDSVIQRWELATFGHQLAHDWSREPTNRAAAWTLSLSYLGFFPVMIAAPAVLWGRRFYTESRRLIFGITLSFFTCYIAFLLFPVAGPPYLWGWPTQTGGLPARMVQDLINRGDSWGSAFPSSHVAASMAAAFLSLKNWRPLGLMLLPFAIGIMVGVVYFQVHYAVDALAGLGIAVLATVVTSRLCHLRSPAA